MIIAYLIHDLGTLKTCSLTCHSWYIAAVPHLHHTLTLGEGRPRFSHNKLRPLSRLQDLGLIPLIEEIRVDQVFDTTYWFLPRAFSRRDLRIFSTFANVHTLKLQNMQIYHFISDIERYFGHFSPTLRSITLYDPCCTPRQLSHFFSLFPNLEDIEIWGVCVHLHTPGTAITDMELVSFSVPKLRGRLALCNSSWIETWKHLTASCGGLRFRHVHIHGSTYCVPFLLEALSETLETLQLSADNDAVSKEIRSGSLHTIFKLIVNRKSQSIGAQGPPISTSRGLGSVSRRLPCFRHRGGILNYHFSCVLRGRCRPRGLCRLVSSGSRSQVVQDTAYDE